MMIRAIAMMMITKVITTLIMICKLITMIAVAVKVIKTIIVRKLMRFSKMIMMEKINNHIDNANNKHNNNNKNHNITIKKDKNITTTMINR